MTSYKTNWKKDRVKRLIKNWRPITLLNVDSKLISKYLANRLQDVMPSLVSESQRAFINNIEIKDSLQKDGLLMTINIERAFDFAKQFFLISALKW